MKMIFRKLIPLIVIASMLLTSCGGGIDAPDAIDWSDPESAITFDEIGEVDNTFELDVLPEGDDNVFGETEYSFPEPFPEIDCDDYETHTATCGGDSKYGFDTVDGVFFFYIDGDCYRPSPNTSQDDIDAIKSAVAQIKELKTGRGWDIGIAAFGAAGAYGAYMAFAAEGCIVAGVPTLGGACLPFALGLIAGVGIGLFELGKIIVNYVKIHKEKKFMQDMIDKGSLIPCGGK